MIWSWREWERDWKGSWCEISEAEQGDQKEEDMVVSERTSVVGA